MNGTMLQKNQGLLQRQTHSHNYYCAVKQTLIQHINENKYSYLINHAYRLYEIVCKITVLIKTLSQHGILIVILEQNTTNVIKPLQQYISVRLGGFICLAHIYQCLRQCLAHRRCLKII